MEKIEIRQKRKARRLALQALYQWLMTQLDCQEIEFQFQMNNDFSKIDAEYFKNILYAVCRDCARIDGLYKEYLDREVESLNAVECCLLRIGTYELAEKLEIPYKVILDEAVNMSREFGSQDGHKYVNGVLNQVARKLRAVEIAAQP